MKSSIFEKPRDWFHSQHRQEFPVCFDSLFGCVSGTGGERLQRECIIYLNAHPPADKLTTHGYLTIDAAATLGPFLPNITPHQTK